MSGLKPLEFYPKLHWERVITYTQKQRCWLMNFYPDGRCELSNNLAENSIPPFVIGRKNWLFCNSQKGAKASAIVYSIIETAKTNGLKPFSYLQFLVETLPNTSTDMLDLLLGPSRARVLQDAGEYLAVNVWLVCRLRMILLKCL